MRAENVELVHHPILGQEPKWWFFRYEWGDVRRTTQEFAAKDEATHRLLVQQRINDLEREATRLRSVLAYAPAAAVS